MLKVSICAALFSNLSERAFAQLPASADASASVSCAEPRFQSDISWLAKSSDAPMKLSNFGCASLLQPIAPIRTARAEDQIALKISAELAALPDRPARKPEYIIASLTLNLVPRGDFSLLAFADGDYWLSAADANTLALSVSASAEREYRGEKYVYFKAMGAQQLAFRERDLSLSMELPASIFVRQALTTVVIPTVRQTTGHKEFSSILNYQTSFAAQPGNESRSHLQLNTELATRWQGILFRHTSAYLGGDAPTRYARYETQAIYDEPEKLRRWTLGDAITNSGTFGSALPIGGLSLTKFYGFDARLIRSPLAGFSTIVSTPSELTVSYQGLPLLQKQLQPGPVDISNLLYYGGARPLDVTIRDSLGRIRTFNIPFYFTDEVLRKGVDEYSYQVGKLRSNPGTAQDKYGDTAALAFHRLGISDNLTLGLRGETSRDIANGGLLAAIKSNELGIFSGNFSYGGDHRLAQYSSARQFSYGYQVKDFIVRLSISRIGDAYRTVSDNLNSGSIAGRILREWRSSLSYSFKGLGTVTADVSRQRNATGAVSQQRQLSLSRQLGHGLIAFLNFNQTLGAGARREVFLTFNWSFDLDYNAGLTARRSDVDGGTYSSSFNKMVPIGPGAGYRIDTDSQRNGDTSADRVRAFGQYNADAVQLRADVSTDRFGNSASSKAYSVDAAGAISFAGGRVNLSRPIVDSFAVVALSEPIANVKVYQNNQLAGVTNSDGKLLLPALGAFQENQLRLDHRDIALDYNFASLEKSLYPPFRSGQFWQIDVVRTQTFSGKLRIRVGNDLRAVPPGSGKLFANALALPFLIGNDGAFYIDQISAGEYVGEILIDSRRCNFKLTIPVTKESYVKLGQIIACE